MEEKHFGKWGERSGTQSKEGTKLNRGCGDLGGRRIEGKLVGKREVACEMRSWGWVKWVFQQVISFYFIYYR